MMKPQKVMRMTMKQILTYLRDYRFSSILLKYFLLLFICLAVPITVLNMWYGNRIQTNMQEEIVRRNEASLEQAYGSVNSAIQSSKNMAYSISVQDSVQYLAFKKSVGTDTTGNTEELMNMFPIVRTANEYIDSMCIYFEKSEEIISDQGIYSYESYPDKACLELYSDDMKQRAVLQARSKNDKYPYLLTVLYPISAGNSKNVGAVVINIDVEKLGDYIGSGKYRNKDYAPVLLVFDKDMETLVYSDEYYLFREGIEEFQGISRFHETDEICSQVRNLRGESYVISEVYSEREGLRYFYLTSMQQFESQSEGTNQIMRSITVLIGCVCLILACLLAIWVYNPIQHTIRILKDVSLLTEWDKKEHIDEMEAIQRSIFSARNIQDNLNEQIQERIVSLHNAQICALQSQINPHFLYNTLEAIGNVAALLMNGENKVTEMIYALGCLMRISLSGENYLVPINEELEHVRLYVKLIDFRFRDRIQMHVQIPEEMLQERIVKLTLQPLIENAIEHGFMDKRMKGDIWIEGKKEGDRCYIYVTDNGLGISDEELHHLKKQLKDSAITGSSHIGLRNVDQRLKLVFGEEYGLEVNKADEKGVSVTICFHSL